MPRPIYCLMFKNLCGMKEKFIKEGPRTRPYDQLWKSSLTGILIILFLLWQRPPGTLEVLVDEGSLPITPDVSVYTVGEAGNNTTDTEEFNNSKMTKQTPQSWFLAKKIQCVLWLRCTNVYFLGFWNACVNLITWPCGADGRRNLVLLCLFI